MRTKTHAAHLPPGAPHLAGFELWVSEAARSWGSNCLMRRQDPGRVGRTLLSAAFEVWLIFGVIGFDLFHLPGPFYPVPIEHNIIAHNR
jgi:hypothetical protein